MFNLDYFTGRIRLRFTDFCRVGAYRSRGNACERGYYEIGNTYDYGYYIPTRPPLFSHPPGHSQSSLRPQKRLKITHIDPCISHNGRLHHTKQYHLMLREHHQQLVIRRGQPFCMKLTLDREFRPEYDGMSLLFLLSGEMEKPCIGKRTEIVVPLVTDGSVHPNETCWSAQLLANKNKILIIQVIASSMCIIGEWKMEIDIKMRNESEGSSYLYKDSIYIIFNPWCSRDQVYLDSKEKLQEYVLSDSTIIYRGSYNDIVGMPWYLGQYCTNILDLIIVLISVIRKVCPLKRHDAVHITRTLTAVLNSNNGWGVLTGNWSGKYDGGSPPTQWVGSVAILQQCYKTKEPVKFGQCWVFSGIMTTACRALGIPARSVTGFNCAHDCDGNLLLDKCFDENGKRVFPTYFESKIPNDSSWNFHVWTEVWMKRPDLTPGDYDGWNVVDSTPQEMSDGIFQCGPTSVKSIKHGDIMKPYDGHYVYSEVNADIVHWIYHKNRDRMKFIKCDQTWVGRFISTKAVGSTYREDLTNYYKFPEGTKEERSVMEKALLQCKDALSRFYVNQNIPDLVYDCKLPHAKVIGSDLRILFSIKNKGKSTYNMKISLNVAPTDYNNILYPPIKSETKECCLDPKSTNSVILDLPYDEYKNNNNVQGLYTVSCMVIISDQDYHYFHQDCFRIHLPNVRVEVTGTPRASEKCTAKVTITNPLSTTLTNGQIILEGSEIAPGTVHDLQTDLGPKQSITRLFTWTPMIPGSASLCVLFNCDQISDARGQCVFIIKKKRN